MEAIGNNRYLTANVFRDLLMIHIREYNVENGKSYPTKKGVVFNKTRWATFMSHLEDIKRCVDLLKWNEPVDYYQHIGGRYYVSMSKDVRCVHIRRYFMPLNSSKEHPTRSGIALRLDEWDTLMTKIPQLVECLPELKDAKPCDFTLDHANQEGYLRCTECNPFGVGHITDLNK